MPHAALCVSGRTDQVGCYNPLAVSMPHAALCVSGHYEVGVLDCEGKFQCRTRHYVCRDFVAYYYDNGNAMFQCRTRHDVCRDLTKSTISCKHTCFNAARGIMCVGTIRFRRTRRALICFNAARGIMCVGTALSSSTAARSRGFNAARGIMCVGTMCPAALVPCGLRRRFGKTKRRNAALRPCRSTSHFLLLYDSTRFVLFQ